MSAVSIHVASVRGEASMPLRARAAMSRALSVAGGRIVDGVMGAFRGWGLVEMGVEGIGEDQAGTEAKGGLAGADGRA